VPWRRSLDMSALAGDECGGSEVRTTAPSHATNDAIYD